MKGKRLVRVSFVDFCCNFAAAGLRFYAKGVSLLRKHEAMRRQLNGPVAQRRSASQTGGFECTGSGGVRRRTG